MNFGEVFSIVTTAILSIGGSGAIIFALSGWLGKVWADRLMLEEKAQHQVDLENLRSDLEKDRTEKLEELKRQLDVAVAHHIRETQDKIGIYRGSINVIADLFADLDKMEVDGVKPADAAERFDRFNRGRIKAYGHMAMLAPQSVMDAFDAMVDYCLLVANGSEKYEWPRVRDLALMTLNEIRKDIGIDKSPIEYKGQL